MQLRAAGWDQTGTKCAKVKVTLTKGLERINRELKRHTRVATLFPNAASCLRLVSALLTEFDEEWMTDKIYLTMNP